MLTHRTIPELRLLATGLIKADPFKVRFVPWREQIAEQIAQYYAEILLETLDFLADLFDLTLPSPVPEIFVVPPEELVETSYYYPPARAIILPLRTKRFTIKEEREWMAAAARHELTHAMTHHCLYREGWHWLCEAFAVWVETQFPGSHYLIYAQPWCDQPLRPLRSSGYDAFPFITFLSDYLGKAALKELWNRFNRYDPWGTVRNVVAAAGKDLKWFFADYCLYSYFPSVGGTTSQEIFKRYGHRLAEECRPVTESRVESLACRYYRVPRPTAARAVRIIGEGAEWNQLQVSAAQVLPDAVMGEYIRGGCEKSIDFSLKFGEADHVIVVVSNDGQQRCEFTLRVQPDHSD